jgi:hypothetical protein
VNEESVFGGYLEPAWRTFDWVSDPSGKSFIFTLLNHLGVPPAKFALVKSSTAAWLNPGYSFRFGEHDIVIGPVDQYSDYPSSFSESLGRGGSLFAGDGANRWGRVNFVIGRWELWKLA